MNILILFLALILTTSCHAQKQVTVKATHEMQLPRNLSMEQLEERCTQETKIKAIREKLGTRNSQMTVDNIKEVNGAFSEEFESRITQQENDEMHARWQLKYPNAIPFDQYMKSAKDSLFLRGYYDYTYVLTYGHLEVDAFHFHDLGITADLNGDGIADSPATWHFNVSAGICGITKKSPNRLIEFFEVEMD